MKCSEHIIWNHHEECIQISTNIGWVICEIGFEIENIWEKKEFVYMVKQNERVLGRWVWWISSVYTPCTSHKCLGMYFESSTAYSLSLYNAYSVLSHPTMAVGCLSVFSFALKNFKTCIDNLSLLFPWMKKFTIFIDNLSLLSPKMKSSQFVFTTFPSCSLRGANSIVRRFQYVLL